MQAALTIVYAGTTLIASPVAAKPWAPACLRLLEPLAACRQLLLLSWTSGKGHCLQISLHPVLIAVQWVHKPTAALSRAICARLARLGQGLVPAEAARRPTAAQLQRAS